jgi:hypothetical protein
MKIIPKIFVEWIIVLHNSEGISLSIVRIPSDVFLRTTNPIAFRDRKIRYRGNMRGIEACSLILRKCRITLK